MAPVPPPLIAVVGATASGKTDLSLALAQRLPVEILVADSRQVYRGMDVGTAKVGPDARRLVRHHLLDLADPDEPFTVADWVAHARQAIPEIVARGALPLVVGGTGLYLTSLVDGYDFAAQPRSPELRVHLTAELEAEGLPALAARLAELDPATAASTDLRNPRRVLRALERAEAGVGERVAPRADPWRGRVALVGVSRPRDVLHRRIEARARELFDRGLLDETRRLLDAGYGPHLPAMTGHGYGEAAAHLAGEMTLSEAVESTARRTRQYAKRQLTWFRRDRRVVWLPAGEGPADERSLVSRVDDLVRPLIA